MADAWYTEKSFIYFYVVLRIRMNNDMKKYVPYVLVALVAGALVYAFVANKPAAPGSQGPAPEPGAPGAEAPADAVVGGQTEAASGNYPKFGLPYVESGYRFQFADCHGTPGSLSVKRGKYFLLDNRDDEAHTIAVAGQSYRIGAYGAAVAAVWKTGTHQITCDGGGAASINVEP